MSYYFNPIKNVTHNIDTQYLRFNLSDITCSNSVVLFDTLQDLACSFSRAYDEAVNLDIKSFRQELPPLRWRDYEWIDLKTKKPFPKSRKAV